MAPVKLTQVKKIILVQTWSKSNNGNIDHNRRSENSYSLLPNKAIW